MAEEKKKRHVAAIEKDLLWRFGLAKQKPLDVVCSPEWFKADNMASGVTFGHREFYLVLNVIRLTFSHVQKIGQLYPITSYIFNWKWLNAFCGFLSENRLNFIYIFSKVIKKYTHSRYHVKPSCYRLWLGKKHISCWGACAAHYFISRWPLIRC